MLEGVTGFCYKCGKPIMEEDAENQVTAIWPDGTQGPKILLCDGCLQSFLNFLDGKHIKNAGGDD